MAYLIATSVLARLANAADADDPTAVGSVIELHCLGETLHDTPQVVIEFRNVATRPTAANGLGLSAADAEMQAAGFEATFSLLPDTPDIYLTWKSLVEALGVIGKQVHDASLVALRHVHDLSHLLTFNVSHFTRMAGFGPGIIVVDPASV